MRGGHSAGSNSGGWPIIPQASRSCSLWTLSSERQALCRLSATARPTWRSLSASPAVPARACTICTGPGQQFELSKSSRNDLAEHKCTKVDRNHKRLTRAKEDALVSLRRYYACASRQPDHRVDVRRGGLPPIDVSLHLDAASGTTLKPVVVDCSLMLLDWPAVVQGAALRGAPLATSGRRACRVAVRLRNFAAPPKLFLGDALRSIALGKLSRRSQPHRWRPPRDAAAEPWRPALRAPHSRCAEEARRADFGCGALAGSANSAVAALQGAASQL